MTVHQRAYELIDQLGEDDVRAVIQVMIKMLPTAKQEKERNID